MASSYFEPQPASKNAAAAELLDVPDGKTYPKMSLLSPQLTRILDDLDLEERSSSEEEGSLSEDSFPADQGAKSDHKARRDSVQTHSIRKTQTPPLSQSKHVRLAPPAHRPGLGTEKHPHLARFHSLRSLLFSSHIEENMTKCKEAQAQAQAQAEAGAKWRAEHDSRRGLNRPRTPEKEKEGIVNRLSNKLKRMTSKEIPTMEKIGEDVAGESTASSDDDYDGPPSRGAGSDEEINHSDIEDLVRWVSRRDPPSDGEARTNRLKQKADRFAKQDGSHESLGLSDVEELVRWVSRKELPPHGQEDGATVTVQAIPRHNYSDASTESDSANDENQRDSSDEDADELVRWISHRDGLKAGPVRTKHPGF